MAKSAKARAKQTGKQDNRLVRYFKETRTEVRKVVWPTRRQATNLTLIVLGVTMAMSVFLGVLDYVFQRALDLIL
jgi:preprotein translocase subunit SecE